MRVRHCTCGCSLTAAVPQLEHLRHDRQVQSAVVEATFLLLVGVVVEGGRQTVWYIVPHSMQTRLNRGTVIGSWYSTIQCTVIDSVADPDPGSGAFRDPGWVKNQDPYPG